ncbi:hypothetical protein DRB96_10285 [Streptomyces sp. ICC1]|nr:hypothetical protein DRB89_27335 [Streptomyces sp. ICC4]AWZ12646.1 hypothetical protein DRB96_10285 [Streptomyces sp. ICC1]
MHRPLRPASAEPATLTVAAAYEGAVTMKYTLNRALTCSGGPVRFGAYNGLVTTNLLDSNAFTSAPAAGAVAR